MLNIYSNITDCEIQGKMYVSTDKNDKKILGCLITYMERHLFRYLLWLANKFNQPLKITLNWLGYKVPTLTRLAKIGDVL